MQPDMIAEAAQVDPEFRRKKKKGDTRARWESVEANFRMETCNTRVGVGRWVGGGPPHSNLQTTEDGTNHRGLNFEPGRKGKCCSRWRARWRAPSTGLLSNPMNGQGGAGRCATAWLHISVQSLMYFTTPSTSSSTTSPVKYLLTQIGSWNYNSKHFSCI